MYLPYDIDWYTYSPLSDYIVASPIEIVYNVDSRTNHNTTMSKLPVDFNAEEQFTPKVTKGELKPFITIRVIDGNKPIVHYEQLNPSWAADQIAALKDQGV